MAQDRERRSWRLKRWFLRCGYVKRNYVVIVNARLDPLSRRERRGNCSHATSAKHEFSLETPPYPFKPPALPATPTQAQFEQIFLPWFGAVALHDHDMKGLAAFLERNDPGGRVLSGFFPARPLVGP